MGEQGGRGEAPAVRLAHQQDREGAFAMAFGVGPVDVGIQPDPVAGLHRDGFRRRRPADGAVGQVATLVIGLS